MATETPVIAPFPCPFCRASLYSDTVAWYHPGVITDRDCVLSGMGFYDNELAAWNTRATPALPEDVRGLIERLRALRSAWADHAEAIDRMNAARPNSDVLKATRAEYALYDERYQASSVAQRNMQSVALGFAKWIGESDAADALQRLHRPVPSREAIKAQLRRWHRDAYYPEAMDVDLELGADAILALLNQETTDHVGEGEA